MKSLGVYMSLRGHLDWLPRRHSMFSGAYATAADNEQQCNENQNRSDQIQSIQMFTKKNRSFGALITKLFIKWNQQASICR